VEGENRQEKEGRGERLNFGKTVRLVGRRKDGKEGGASKKNQKKVRYK